MTRKAPRKPAPPEIGDLSFVNPVISALGQVGSREVEIEIERLKGQGRKVIPVYGYPVVAPPAHICQAAAEAAKRTCFPPSNGLPELRKNLAKAIQAQYGAEVDAETEILVTNGAMHGLHVVMTTFLKPGDEVLLMAPCYFFGGLIEITGARPVYVQTDESDGYALDFPRIRKSVSRKTRLVVLSSPVNPTGYVYSRQDVEDFIALAEERNLLLVSDESYDRMLYDGREHVSPFHYPEGRSRTVLVKSFTKSYALPTWRVGYLVGPSGLVTHFRKVLEWTVLHCPYINQRVALAALQGPQEWLSNVFRAFEERRNQLLEGLAAIESLSCVRPPGGPFIFLNVSQHSEDCDPYARHLLHRYGIPAVPGKHFHARDHVRIPFGGTAESVAQLACALAEAGKARPRNRCRRPDGVINHRSCT